MTALCDSHAVVPTVAVDPGARGSCRAGRGARERCILPTCVQLLCGVWRLVRDCGSRCFTRTVETRDFQLLVHCKLVQWLACICVICVAPVFVHQARRGARF